MYHFSLCFFPLSPCQTHAWMERNPPWSKGRSQFWGWGRHPLSLYPQSKPNKGYGRAGAPPSTNSVIHLLPGFASTFNHLLLVDHCYRWQLYTSLKFTQTIRWPMSLSQNRLCRFLLREACPNYLRSDVALIFLSLQVLLLVGTDVVTNFQWWGEH